MSIKQRNVVLVSKDKEGNTCIDMPLTVIEQIENWANAIASVEEARAGVDNTKIMTPYLVKLITDAVASTACPTGMIAFFAVKEIPAGWLLCNGANVSRTEYAKLFSIWGTKWGAGDGSTTFALPNLEGRFLEGTTDLSKVGNYVEAGLPNISGAVEEGYFTDNVLNESWNWESGAMYWTRATVINRNTDDGSGGYGKRLNFDASRSSSIYSSSSVVQPPSMLALPCIKA